MRSLPSGIFQLGSLQAVSKGAQKSLERAGTGTRWSAGGPVRGTLPTPLGHAGLRGDHPEVCAAGRRRKLRVQTMSRPLPSPHLPRHVRDFPFLSQSTQPTAPCPRPQHRVFQGPRRERGAPRAEARAGHYSARTSRGGGLRSASLRAGGGLRLVR